MTFFQQLFIPTNYVKPPILKDTTKVWAVHSRSSQLGGEHAVITVYVYDHNLDHIPDGVTSDLLNQELQKAKRDIFSSKPDAIQIGDDEEILREAISYKFAAFDLPDKWEPDFSLLHMTARGNFFVKVRSTMASNRHLNRSLHDQDLFLRE
jgi:hypothetical protein